MFNNAGMAVFGQNGLLWFGQVAAGGGGIDANGGTGIIDNQLGKIERISAASTETTTEPIRNAGLLQIDSGGKLSVGGTYDGGGWSGSVYNLAHVTLGDQAQLTVAHWFHQEFGSLETLSTANGGSASATIQGDVRIQGGSVVISSDPGTYGTLNVTGSVEMFFGTTLVISVDGAGTSSDLLNVTGSVTLAFGCTASFWTDNAIPPDGSGYDFIHSAGITGDFANPTYNGFWHNYVIDYVDGRAILEKTNPPGGGGGG